MPPEDPHSVRGWEPYQQPLSAPAEKKRVPIRQSEPAAELLLHPAGTLLNDEGRLSPHLVQRNGNLAVAIRQRIESRLGGRIRDLSVRVCGKRVVLAGRCATYYTKQLAQHAALGVIEDEQLENEIEVTVLS